MSIVKTRHTSTQPSSGGRLHPTRHVYCTPPPPGAMHHLLREQASRWCHQFACLVLTIEVNGSKYSISLTKMCVTHQVPLVLEEWICRICLRRKIDKILNLQRIVATLVVPTNDIFCIIWYKRIIWAGSGCGSVGRAVTSDTRGPQFESSHRQMFIWDICLLSTVLTKKAGGQVQHQSSQPCSLANLMNAL